VDSPHPDTGAAIAGRATRPGLIPTSQPAALTGSERNPSRPGEPYKGCPQLNLEPWGIALMTTPFDLLAVAAREAAYSGIVDKFRVLAGAMEALYMDRGDDMKAWAVHGGLAALESALDSKNEIEARNVAALVCLAFDSRIPDGGFDGMLGQVTKLRTIAGSLPDGDLSESLCGIADQLATEALVVQILLGGLEGGLESTPQAA
jgi:hypothetical protein